MGKNEASGVEDSMGVCGGRGGCSSGHRRFLIREFNIA